MGRGGHNLGGRSIQKAPNPNPLTCLWNVPGLDKLNLPASPVYWSIEGSGVRV